MGFVKNLMAFNTGVDLAFKQVADLGTDAYRSFIWDVFLRILKETPQWSGKAVANWNISIHTPNFNFDDSLGDEVGRYGVAHEKGDERWIRIARERNRPIVKRVRYRDKVFISNGVVGDTDGGKSAHAYMEALQDPGYWATKLRAVNKPYETAQESVIVVATRYGSRGFALPKVSGDSWREP